MISPSHHLARRVKVACIGDSITYGYLLDHPERDAYPAQLQRMLGDGYEVRNFGVPGLGVYLHLPWHTTANGRRAWSLSPECAAALAWEPDVVISNLGANDLEEYPKESLPVPDGAPALARGTFRRQYADVLNAFKAGGLNPRILLWTRLCAMKGEAAARNDRAASAIADDLKAVAAEVGAEGLDVYAATKDSAATDDWPDEVHPSVSGHRAIAALCAKFLVQGSTIFSVPDGERLYGGYAVTVDGAEAPVSEVRCSAMPFNRRWPGHQRQIEQTELCGMVRFAFAGKATVSVTADRDFASVKVRPLSRGVSVRREGRTATFEITRPGGYSVEFDGWHNNLHVFADALAAANADALRRDGDTIVFGPGVHDVGIMTLKSGDTVLIDPGAVVYGGFHAKNASGISILGCGIIDGGRLKEEILFETSGDGSEDVHNAKRWHTVDFRSCRGIRIDGPTIRDSLLYNIAMWGCEDIDVRNVKIVGQWRFNTDGIDLHNCRRAHVSDCFARTFDDTFCFKAHEGYGNCEDGVFERCVAWNDWGKVFEVGVECRAEHLRRLAFRDCDCIHAVGALMDVANVDYGRVSDVLFEDIRFECDEPMPSQQIQKSDESVFDAAARLDRPPRLFQSSVSYSHEFSNENGGKWTGGGFIDGVTVRGVALSSASRVPKAGICIVALDEMHRPKNIVIENATLDGNPIASPADVVLELHGPYVLPKFVAAAVPPSAKNDAAEWPLIIIRHTTGVNDLPDIFNQLADCHRRHPGACDEFWFATGSRKTIPALEEECAKFAAYRSVCDEIGVTPSYQQGLTLGHGATHDGPPKPDAQVFPEDAWQVGRDGQRLGFLCPRSPFVLDYEFNYAKTVLRVANPGSYWIDDDLRLGVFKPDGCFCPRCIAAFNAKTDGNWTRETLVERLYSDAEREPVRAAWIDFNAESLALYAAKVREAADALGSPCRLAYQAVWADTIYTGYDTKPILKALSGPARRSVGIRPGAGFYIEAEPRGMVFKCLSVAREAERCRTIDEGRGPPNPPADLTPRSGDLSGEAAFNGPQGRFNAASGGLVASICYEQETYPRHVLHKSPGAIMTECALALASGCDSLSLYWYAGEAPEPIEEYDRFVRTLAKARPYFERLAASTRRTRLGGVARFVGSAAAETPDFDLRDPKDFDLACAGVPVTVAESGTKVWYLTEKSRREMTEADRATLASGAVVEVEDIGKYPLASRRAKLLDDLDAATNGTFPVRVDACRPLRILPRVRDDGRLDSVTILSLSIGDTDELAIRVRRPVSSQAAMQSAKMAAPIPLPCVPGALPGEFILTLDNLPGWQAVTLFFAIPRFVDAF